MAAEAASDDTLDRAAALTGAPPALAVTYRRAAALGLCAGEQHDRPGGFLLVPPPNVSAGQIHQLVDPTRILTASLPILGKVTEEAEIAGAAIELAKLARLLPAMLLYEMPARSASNLARSLGLMELDRAMVLEHRTNLAYSLKRVTDAEVPLADAENTRIIAFRPDDGGTEHLAIVIGEPRPDAPVLVRIHSECFTGDLLGSLRCDCGEQLRGAIKAIGESGSGIVIYLAQEGRGIGLVNKLRAYRLQDAGADTIEANEQLGFEADERVYQPAAEILRQLGFEHVRLLTNNPAKVEALAQHGITVTERVPHVFAANEHNHHYLATKASRSGHLF